jgi:hypothetical protein
MCLCNFTASFIIALYRKFKMMGKIFCHLSLILSREIYSQIGCSLASCADGRGLRCSLARYIAICPRNIAMLQCWLTSWPEQLATVSGSLTSGYIRNSTFSYLIKLPERKCFPLTQQYYIKIWICIYLEKSEAFREYAEEASLQTFTNWSSQIDNQHCNVQSNIAMYSAREHSFWLSFSKTHSQAQTQREACGGG